MRYTSYKNYLDNKIIKETWNYFYENIVWPSSEDKENFELNEQAGIKIDTVELLNILNEMIKVFEKSIRKKEKRNQN